MIEKYIFYPMFCTCNTILLTTTCPRCKNESNTLEPLIYTKSYHRKEAKEIKKVSGAMIKYTCASCGCEEMEYNTIQTRSADEGQTVFYVCKCGYKEKINS